MTLPLRPKADRRAAGRRGPPQRAEARARRRRPDHAGDRRRDRRRHLRLDRDGGGGPDRTPPATSSGAAQGRRSSSRSCCSASCCALAALCYAELASMIPQAGSAYAYTYATLGEIVAWIIGWDLILEYAVGNVAVAISWGDYFKTLTRRFGCTSRRGSRTGYRTALLSSDRRCTGCSTPRRTWRHPDPRQPAGVRDRHGDHVAAAARRAGERARQQHHGGVKLLALGLFIVVGADAHQPGELPPVRAERLRAASTRARRSSSSRTSASTRFRRPPKRRRIRSATCRSAFSADSRSARSST